MLELKRLFELGCSGWSLAAKYERKKFFFGIRGSFVKENFIMNFFWGKGLVFAIPGLFVILGVFLLHSVGLSPFLILEL